jgi:hypothetical protein
MQFSFKFKRRIGIEELQKNTRQLIEILAEEYVERHLRQNPKYQNPKKLNRFEYQVFSQNGEDGIIEEIFKRIGTTNQFFVEFGAANGLWNNTTLLLVKGWRGLWIEGEAKWVEEIKAKFAGVIKARKLQAVESRVTPENIEKLFRAKRVPQELDLLSIDIDGNDYWVWAGLKNYRPRAVVIEYNSLFRPDTKWVMKYNPQHRWNQTCYAGASLKSLELLGAQKGYKLVGCDFLGVNAFFVRQDLVKNKFLKPYTAANHYEPPRFFLSRSIGHPRDFGDFEVK